MKFAVFGLIVTFVFANIRTCPQGFTGWGCNIKTDMDKSNPNFKKSGLFETYLKGNLGPGKYLTGQEVNELTANMQKAYPELVRKVNIGKTYENREMPAFIFATGLPKGKVEHLAAARKRTAMLIDGAHHCRELTTISMVSTIMMKFIHGYVHYNKD